MTALVDRARTHAPVLAVVVVTTAWTVLAISNPTSTYHFAPIITAAIWPLVARWTRGRRTGGEAARAGIGGFVAVVLMVGELTVANALEGPASFGLDAWAEALLFGAVGAVAGALWSMLPER